VASGAGFRSTLGAEEWSSGGKTGLCFGAEDKDARRHMWGRREKVGVDRHSARRGGGQVLAATVGCGDRVTGAILAHIGH
jgi:hypothetical protein